MMKSNKIWGVILPMIFLVGLLLAARPESAHGQEDKLTPDVEPGLQAQILNDSTVGYLIYFREKADLTPAYDLTWEARGEFVVKALQDTANSSQVEIVKYLDDQKVDYQSFWIDNLIIVNSSSQNTFNGLMNFSEIESLKTRRTMGVINPTIEVVPESILAIEPNISHVLAPDVWGLGITGSGIVVANIDTGVRSTHDALVRQYRGTIMGSHDFNWLGAAGGSGTPVDDHGHGTHTMGTMIGEDASQTNQIGMAPGAQWIACDGCEGASCPDAALLTCAQWVAAPYPIGDPGSPNASMRPHVVNNSWGDCGTSYDSWFQASVDAWHAAGIYPIFSNGNAGNCSYPSPPGLNTVGNPARYGNITGVGSTGESNGQYAPHSNWGPTDNLDIVNPTTGWANLKPQVLAPGVSIRSSTPGSDSQYQDGWSGTSMSAPHVSGLVALMWQAASCLIGDYAATETIIENTAIPILYNDGTTSGAHWPNYAAGWGEINSLAAVQAAQNFCGGGTLNGKISDAITGNPIENAEVSATLHVTQTFSTSTDSIGEYELILPVGTFTVTATGFGYLPNTISAVDVISGITTTLDFDLTPATHYQMSGTVTDAATGWPLYASIDINGYPGEMIWTDPETGYYEINLAEGITYTFGVEAWVPGYLPDSAMIGPLMGDITHDFALDVDASVCSAPGYILVTTPLLSETFDSGIPGSWLVIDKSGGTGCPWSDTDPGNRGNLTDGSGAFAIADSDECGFGTVSDTDLDSPTFDASSFSSLQISYANDFNDLGSIAQVQVWDGSSWVTVEDMSGTDHRGPETRIINTTTGGGHSNAIVRFHYEAGWDWWWEVDEVEISGAECVPPAGGLVVGNVYDDNTLEAMNGVMVENEDGYMAEALATPLDEGVADGFYSIFSPAGSKTFTATLNAPYGPDVDLVGVTTGDTIRHDFYLPAPSVNVNPADLEVTLVEGYSVTVPLDLVNNGAVGTDFELVETGGSVLISIPANQDRINDNTTTRQPFTGASTAKEFLIPMGLPTVANFDVLILTPDANVSDLVASLSAFSDLNVTVYADDLSTLSAVELAGYDVVMTTNNTRWSAIGVDVSVGNALADFIDAGGKLIVNAFAYDWAGWQLAGRFITEQYGSFSGTSNDFTGTSTLGTIHDPTHPVLNGVKAISNSYLWQNPGLAPGATLLAEWSDGNVFLAVNENVVALNILPSDGNGVPGWTGDLPTLYHNAIVWLSDSSMDIPWLSTDPITGTLAADSMQVIDVTFSTLTYTVGTYAGALMVMTDDPVNNKIEVPVTMHIEAVRYGVALSAENDNLGGEPGDVVTYTVWITNTGNLLDGYNMAAGSHDWELNMPTSMDLMAPGNSHAMEVAITIPPDAGNGDSDSVTIIVSSQGDPTETAAITLTAVAVLPEDLIYLPLIFK